MPASKSPAQKPTQRPHTLADHKQRSAREPTSDELDPHIGETPKKGGLSEAFRVFARKVSNATGSPTMFLAALFVVVLWGVSGPLFAFSDTWQLVINTGTTIVTFLMVFLIQNTQNRDSAALHAKLDELLIATTGAHNQLAAAEDLSDEELNHLKEHFEHLAETGVDIEDEIKETEKALSSRKSKTNSSASARS